MSDVKQNRHRNADGTMSFWGHLEELRGHLVRSAIAIFLAGIAAFLAKNIVFDYIILAPKETYFFTNKLFCQISELLNLPALCINKYPLKLINIDMAGQFTTHIYTSLVAGLIVAIPYVIWEIWRFILPGLEPNERKHSTGAVLVTSALFLTGVFFAYFLIVPLSINFLGSYQVSSLVENQVALRSYISLVVTICLATGIVFELPVFVYFISKTGLLTPEFMKKHRKLAFVIILILSAIITPPDVFSQIMVGVPLVILYEISIGICRRVTKRMEEALA